MIKLYKKSTNEFLGRVREEQFQVLPDYLEDESLDDRDYYITRETLDTLEQSGADPGLIQLLRAAMKPELALELRWEKEELPS
jgi:hypothetical protein